MRVIFMAQTARRIRFAGKFGDGIHGLVSRVTVMGYRRTLLQNAARASALNTV